MKNKQTIKRIPYYAFSCKKSYYLTHPLKFLREIRTLIGNVKHRLLYSWDWPSLWNMDSFLGQLIPSMLRELAERSCGTPYDIEEEEYKAYLMALARLFEIANIDKFDEEYEGARTSLLELHDEKFSSVERLYARAKVAAKDDLLTNFVYEELGALAARGWLWD